MASKVMYFAMSANRVNPLLVPATSHIKTLEDLGGKPVVSTQGSTSLAELTRINTERLLKLQISPVTDHRDGFNAVVNGKAQAFVMDDVLLAGLRAQSKRQTSTPSLTRLWEWSLTPSCFPKGMRLSRSWSTRKCSA